MDEPNKIREGSTETIRFRLLRNGFPYDLSSATEVEVRRSNYLNAADSFNIAGGKVAILNPKTAGMVTFSSGSADWVLAAKWYDVVVKTIEPSQQIDFPNDRAERFTVIP